MYTASDLTFIVCAYGDNQNLPKTIESLKKQTKNISIILSTSTPSEYLDSIAKQFDIEMVVNPERKGPGCDWNYGYSKAKTHLWNT